MMLAAALAVPCAARAAGPSPQRLIEDGNKAFSESRFADAAHSYEAASRALPASPEAKFNLADARFKQGDLKGARELYLEVLDSAESSETLRRQVQYNLGNAAFAEAEQKLADDDLEGAVGAYRDSVALYRQAAGETQPYDDALAQDARWNIEVTRLRMKRLLDELKRRQEQQKQQQEQDRQFKQKLDKAIEEQQQIADQAKAPENSDEARGKLSERQQENLDRTKELSDDLAKQIEQARQQAAQSGGQTQGPQNVPQAKDKLDKSQTRQAETGEHVRNNDMEQAGQSAQQALDRLKEAREQLNNENQQQPQSGEGQQQQRQSNQQQAGRQGGEQQPQQGEAKRLSEEEAQRLLEQLKHNQARAREARARELEESGYRLFNKQQSEKVTRDW
jgi:hypothetical protein